MKLLIPDLLPNTTYAVEVRAVRTDAVSEWSTRASVTTVSDTVLPLTPVNITWAVSGDSFAASWDATIVNVNNEQINIVRYEVELTANGLTRILSIPQVTGGSVFYTLSFEENRSLFGTPQPTVGFRVRSVSNIDTKSDWSSLRTASNPVPASPTGVTAVAGPNQVNLTWAAPADVDVIGYNIYFGTTLLTFINSTSWTFYTSGYVPTTLTVKAVDKFNQLSAGADSNSVTPTSPSTIDTTAPNTPTALAATITNNANGIGARAAVSWTMASPPSDLAGYYIRYRKVGDTNYSNTSFTKDVLAGTIELQSAYTNYEFQIKAYDWSNNESSWSATVTATSPANAAPSNITTLNSTPTSDSIVYTWTPSSDADLKNYEVTFSTSSTFASGNVTFYTGTSATLSVGGLTPSTTYYARVRAVDTSGLTSSSWSATNTTTTSSVVNSVKDYSVEYALSGSETVAPTTGWSTTAPTRTAGTFIWTRTVVTYQDNTTNTTSPALVTGNTGATGSNGTPAANVYLTATSQVLSAPAGGGATNPATTTVTGSAVNTTITSWTYSVDGAAFSTTVPTGVSRTGNTVTITGVTMTAKMITVQMSDANGVADVLTVAKVSDGATGGTGGTGPAGADAYTVLLSNEAQTFTAGTTNALAATATSTVIAYKGTTLQTATVGTITGGATGISAAVTNNGTTAPLITFTVTTALTTANGTFTIPITVGGMTFNQVFSWSLSFSGAAGSAGTPATSVEVGNDSVAIPVSTTGAALSAGSITIPFSGWIGTTRAAATVSTSALPAGITLGSNTAATNSADGALVLNYASGATIGAADAGSITLTVTCNGQSFTNIFSWSRAYTGATGGTGTSGTSATSLDTSPDVFMIPTNSNGAASAAGSVVVNFKGLVGSTASAVTIGTAPTLPAGITATPSGSGTTNAFITFSWANAATIGAAATGTFAWPLTINGISFTANIGWARAIQGAVGGTGATGKGITSITPYFLQQTSGGATPATPAVSPPAAPWTTTEPTYTTNTELWRTERIIYTDATFAYTTPTKVSSYAAAAQAITSASGKNTITYSTVAPVNGTNTGILGDTWFVRDATTLRIKAQYELTTAPSTWTSRLVDGIIIANLDAGRLTAGIITGQTIQVSNTGSIQSTDYAANSAGWKLSTTGLEINNGSVKASALTAGTLGSSTGVIQIGAGASIVMNGGYLKSTTYTGTTQATNPSGAGFYLGNDGLRIDQGMVSASALIAGTISGTNTIALSGPDAKIVGTGFELSGDGLSVTSGTISSEAIYVTSEFADSVTAATTTIDGGKIRTGSIQSTGLNKVWNVASSTYIDGTQPAWSINMSGGAAFSDVSVTGSIVVGDASQSASHVVGSANYQPGVSGWMIRGDGVAEFNQVTASSLHGSAIEGGTLTIDKISSGNLNAAIVITGNGGISMGSNGAGNAAVKLNPGDGLIIDPVGSAYISIPTNGQPVSFQNVGIIATDITVNDNFELRGASNRISGTLALSTGIDNPTVGPTVTSAWGDRLLGPISMSLTSMGHRYTSLLDGGTVWITVDKSDTGGGSTARRIIGINKTTGAVSDVATADMLGLSSEGNVYGVTKLGTSYYVLVAKSVPSQGVTYVKEFNSSWAQTNEWQAPIIGGSAINITTDGTDLWIVYQSTNPGSDYTKQVIHVPITGAASRVNLVPNPSFEVDTSNWSLSASLLTRSTTAGAQSGAYAGRIESTPTRTNLMPSPLGNVAAYGAAGWGLGSNLTSLTPSGDSISAWSAGPAATGRRYYANGPTVFGIVAGTSYDFAYYLGSITFVTSNSAQLMVRWYNSSGAQISEVSRGFGTDVGYKAVAFVAPAGADRCNVYISAAASTTSGSGFTMKNVTVMQSGQGWNYFTTGDGGADYYWTGAVNNSPSVYHPAIDTYIYTPYMTTVPGSTYAASVYMKGSVAGNTQITINWYDSNNTYISNSVGVTMADTSTGYTRISLVAAAPTGATKAIMLIYAFSMSRGKYQYADAVMFEKASTVGAYFDGSSVAAGKTYGWSGTANASASSEASVAVTCSFSQQYVNTFWVGTADFGGVKKLIAPSFNGVTYVYDAAGGAASVSNNWTAVGSEKTYGLVWDGSKFIAMTVSDGNYPTTSEALSFWPLSAATTDITRSVRYSQYDSISPVHETAWSPAVSATQGARQLLRVSSSSPQGAGGTDEPNRIRHYISTASGPYYLQPDVTAAPWVGLYNTPAVGTASTVTATDFSLVGNPGIVESAKTNASGPLIEFRGDGTWHLSNLVGMIVPWAGTVSTIPDGFLECDGSSYLRSDYPELAAMLGHGFGGGEPDFNSGWGAVDANHFNVPDLRTRVPVGRDSSDPTFDTVGEIGGEKAHILTVAEMPSHSHSVSGKNNFMRWYGTGGNQSSTAGSVVLGDILVIGATGGGAAHNNMQPYAIMRYLIKY